jgi:hypothetical protein
MAYIRLDTGVAPYSGQALTFKSPADCSNIEGLKIYYTDNGVEKCEQFALTDAHGEDVAGSELFKRDVLVRILIDKGSMKAFVQNADTNAYLESRFQSLETVMSTHNHPADKITSGIFAGQVIANAGGQSPSSYIIRNSKIVPSSNPEKPGVDGEICWLYE